MKAPARAPVPALRRQLLRRGATGAASLVAPWLVGCTRKADPHGLPAGLDGALLGPDQARGHRLRDAVAGPVAPGTERRRVDVAIVGAGIAGLAAAWQLRRHGVQDVVVLELETQPGGNARSGHGAAGPFPWGAHYVTLPTPDCVHVQALLTELGLFDPATGAWLESALVHAPQERLYSDGLWHDGLALPLVDDGSNAEGADAARDRSQWQRFEALVAQWRGRRDAQGRPAFALPLDASSARPDWRALDAVDARSWLRAQGIDAPRVLWQVEYATRDDYGGTLDQVSAWAALHYFASRPAGDETSGGGAAGATRGPTGPLTWPQGNAWVVERLAAPLRERLVTGAMVRSVRADRGIDGGALQLDVALADADGSPERPLQVTATHVIWAAPLAVAARVIEPFDAARRLAARATPGSAWVVANLTLDRLPREQGRAALAWDNVLAGTPSLGYVNASHQRIGRGSAGDAGVVLTWYRPLAGMPVAQARALLQQAPWQHWAAQVLAELGRPHPDIAERTRRIDVWRWPHAMAMPAPGAVWGPARALSRSPLGNLHFAHTDASGLSLFEEAVERGAACANAVLRA